MTGQDSFDGMVLAPWTDVTVETLHRYQTSGVAHPYTCPRDHETVTSSRTGTRRYVITPRPVLEATEAGWICPDIHCGYTQRWANAQDADPDMLAVRIRNMEALWAKIR